MRRFWKILTTGIMGGALLSLAPMASAQTTAKPAPAPKMSAPMATAPAQQPGQRVIIVEPIRVFDPFYAYPYPYAYPPDYMDQNFGYVKIDTKRKDDSVYVDGGFADKIAKAKKFALRPGNHDIELRDSDGRRIFRERVAVLVGKTTTLHVGYIG
jgi:hypothetical protein